MLNLLKISNRDGAINNRQYTSPSYEVAKPRKITAISAIITVNNHYNHYRYRGRFSFYRRCDCPL